MKIAIVEDDPHLAAQVATLLEDQGHSCQVMDSAARFYARTKRDTFDLLILDWNLPDSFGIDILTWVRATLGEHVMPVIFLTSRLDDQDIVRALDQGADDYLVKPLNPSQFLARVRAVLRRSFPAQLHESQVFGRYEFSVATSSVTIDGAAVALTQKEFQLALLFLRNVNRILSRAYLMETIWGSTSNLRTRTLDAHVSRIRTKLELRPSAGYRLVPVYSHGYRLEHMVAET